MTSWLGSARRRSAYLARYHGRPMLVVRGVRLWNPRGWNNARGATVTVAAPYTYKSLIPLVPLPPITVTAESSL